MSFKIFLKELNDNKTEGYLLKSLFLSLLIGLATFFLFYFFFSSTIRVNNWIFFSILSILAYAIIMPALLQVRLYGKLPCMSGMMVGMTFGMVAGFLPSYYIAATNGMFYGALFGMVLGIVVGAITGKCCGVMGVMEGVMAGFMGGLMGSMTSIMLLNDHLLAMSIIVLVVCSAIMTKLSYMIYLEGKNLESTGSVEYVQIIILSLLLSAITILFIVFGPRGGIFA